MSWLSGVSSGLLYNRQRGMLFERGQSQRSLKPRRVSSRSPTEALQ